jgi:hypothetical protein
LSAGRLWRIDRASTLCYITFMRPRRAQKQIVIRSDYAAERLKLLTRGGKSQAVVVEEALANVEVGEVEKGFNQELYDALMDISKRGANEKWRYASMAEFDAAEYDERGNPR